MVLTFTIQYSIETQISELLYGLTEGFVDLVKCRGGRHVRMVKERK